MDFTADGGAVVKISDVGEVAFLDMFGFSPISRVKDDIEHADTSDRKRFLEKYLRVYCEMYADGLNENEQLKFQEVNNHLAEKSSAIDVMCRQGDEYANVFEEIFANDEKMQYYWEDYESKSLCVNFFNLKHSSAWYLMGHINADVDAARKRIEMARGWLLFIDHIKEANTILHNQDYSSYEEQLIDIEKAIGLTQEQAEYCLSRSLSDIAQCDVRKVNQEIASKEKEIEFLERLI